jgi:hypothetical protein
VDWLHLAQDRGQWQALVNMVMNLLGFMKGRKFLDWVTVRVSRILLHGICLFVSYHKLLQVLIKDSITDRTAGFMKELCGPPPKFNMHSQKWEGFILRYKFETSVDICKSIHMLIWMYFINASFMICSCINGLYGYFL